MQKAGKVLSRDALRRRLRREKKAGRRIVFTNGCFDLLHAGHVRLLQKARSFGDVLVVGLNTDESVRRLKGEGRPVTPEGERAEILASLDCVDYVSFFSEDTPFEMIRDIRPDVLVKGADYRTDEIVGADIVRASGGAVRRVRLTPGRSTSLLLRRIRRV